MPPPPRILLAKFILLITFIALVLVSCGSSLDDSSISEISGAEDTSRTYTGTIGTDTYKLVITSSSARAAYNPQAGDTYVMTITSSTGNVTVSMGTVKSFIGNVFTLESGGGTFTVGITANTIAEITGTVPESELVFNNGGDFANFFRKLPENTAATAYTIKLKLSDSNDMYYASRVLRTKDDVYVYLDLSGSTFTDMYDYAFAISRLTGIIIPKSVTNIGYEAFNWCDSLTSIIVESGNTNYASEGGILYKVGGGIIFISWGEINGNLNIPNGVTYIGERAFQQHDSITSVTIPDSVTSIGDYAFSMCTSLASVTIGSGVTGIGNYAFSSSSLTSVTFKSHFLLTSFAGFLGDLHIKFSSEGTYTREANSNIWTKQ
jgi:hypothetical protein